MSDTIVVALIGGIAGVVGFFIGKWWERRHETMLIRADMLRPIEEWLGGVERFVGILADTLNSGSAGYSTPAMYSVEERNSAARFMVERTNVVFGIIQSRSLVTSQTNKAASRLAQIIGDLDQKIKYTLLPLDTEIQEAWQTQTIGTELVLKGGACKQMLDSEIQEAHALIAQLKTTLT